MSVIEKFYLTNSRAVLWLESYEKKEPIWVTVAHHAGKFTRQELAQMDTEGAFDEYKEFLFVYNADDAISCLMSPQTPLAEFLDLSESPKSTPYTTPRAILGAIMMEQREWTCREQSEIAHALGITSGYLSKLENGKTATVDAFFLRRWCRSLGMTASEVFDNISLKEDVLDRKGVGIGGGDSKSAIRGKELIKLMFKGV